MPQLFFFFFFAISFFFFEGRGYSFYKIQTLVLVNETTKLTLNQLIRAFITETIIFFLKQDEVIKAG